MVRSHSKFSAKDVISKVLQTPDYGQHFNSFVKYFFSATFKNRDASEIGRQPSEPSCSSTAPRPLWLASHTIRISLCTSKCSISTMFATCFLSISNATWHSFVHTKSFFLFNSGRNGTDVSANEGKNLWRLWIEPINDFSCDSELGATNLSIGSVLQTNGVMPGFVIWWPNHLHSFFANWHFSNYKAIFF